MLPQQHIHWTGITRLMTHIKQTELQYSTDGKQFNTQLCTVAIDARSFSWKPFTNGTLYYRAKGDHGIGRKSLLFNILPLRESASGFTVNNTLVTDIITCSIKEYQYQLLDEDRPFTAERNTNSRITALALTIRQRIIATACTGTVQKHKPQTG